MKSKKQINKKTNKKEKKCIFNNSNCKGKITKDPNLKKYYLCSYHKKQMNTLKIIIQSAVRTGIKIGMAVKT